MKESDVRKGRLFYHATKAKLIHDKLNYKCVFNHRLALYESRSFTDIDDTFIIDWKSSPFEPESSMLKLWEDSYTGYLKSNTTDSSNRTDSNNTTDLSNTTDSSNTA